MWASTSPVAGLIEGSESTGMAVAAISAILTDFEAAMWNLRPRRALAEDATDSNSWQARRESTPPE